MKNLPKLKMVANLLLGLLATLPWSCMDHRIPSTSQLLTNCSTGWRNVNQTYQGSFIGGIAPDCYRLVFGSDGKLQADRTRCLGQDTAPLALGNWSSTETSITLPVFSWNIYGIPGPHRIENLSATSLQFSYRGDPDKIIETWSCE
ncbi:hypothetical protein [Spirosoma litoris]